MRHRKANFKFGRNTGHRRSLIANLMKSLIEHERIELSLAQAKELRRHADRAVTLAKRQTLSCRRMLLAKLMISFNKLTPKEARLAKSGDTSSYNTDRKIVGKLFSELAERFKERPGGYTRIIKLPIPRVGDGAERCVLEYLPE